MNNNQETDRGSVDEVVDEKTQFQMYYPPFEGAIEAGVGSVMCSYNKIRGVWSCENADTLQRDLKERLGFNGWVMSDWGATHSNSSVMAGLDQEMPGSDYLSSDALLSAVKTGALPASRIDDAAMRILTPFFTVGAFDRPNLNTQDSNVSSPENSALARSLAASSIVLLKNSGGALPLSPSGGLRLVLFGKSAIAPVVAGGGSGNVIPSFLPSPYDAIAAKLGMGAPVQGGAPAADPFASPSSQLYPASLPPVCDVSGRSCLFYAEGADTSALTALAASAEVAIVFVSTSSCEGSDRASLGFDSFGDALVEAVAAAGFGRVVVAGVAPGAVLTPWREAVDAITLAFMPGQEYANALADVLFGQVGRRRSSLSRENEAPACGASRGRGGTRRGVSPVEEGKRRGMREGGSDRGSQSAFGKGHADGDHAATLSLVCARPPPAAPPPSRNQEPDHRRHPFPSQPPTVKPRCGRAPTP